MKCAVNSWCAGQEIASPVVIRVFVTMVDFHTWWTICDFSMEADVFVSVADLFSADNVCFGVRL